MDCIYCGREMLEAEGCDMTEVRIKRQWFKRSTEHVQKEGERCEDCGAMFGQPHHVDCQFDKCPKCGAQAISCDCMFTGWRNDSHDNSWGDENLLPSQNN